MQSFASLNSSQLESVDTVEAKQEAKSIISKAEKPQSEYVFFSSLEVPPPLRHLILDMKMWILNKDIRQEGRSHL